MSTVAGAPASGRVVLPDEVCAAMVGASVRVTGNVAKIDAAAGTATLEQVRMWRWRTRPYPLGLWSHLSLLLFRRREPVHVDATRTLTIALALVLAALVATAQSELVIDLSNCGTCSGVDGHHGGGGAPPVVGRTFQFIGEVVRREVGAGVAVAARISRDVTGIDMPLYANAVRLRRARGYP